MSTKDLGNIRFSVVIPAHDAERYVKCALNSVLAQSYCPAEVIVVDDGSSDNTRAKVRQFEDRVKYIHQDNAGPSHARNTGIRAATGDFIAFLDADDEWLPTHLEKAAEVLSRFPQLCWYSCAYTRKPRNSKIGRILRFNNKLTNGSIIENYFRAAALSRRCNIHTNTVIARRSLLLSLGGFKEGMHRGEDRLMWFRLGLREPRLGYSDNVGAAYYQVTGSATSKDDLRDSCDFISSIVSALKEDTAVRLSQSCIPFLNQLIYREIHSLYHKRDRNSLRRLRDEYGEYMIPRNVRLIQLGLSFPNAMKAKAILADSIRRQEKRTIAMLLRIRRFMHQSST